MSMELKPVVLVGGCPKGHERSFDPATLQGKRLRTLLGRTSLTDARLIDLWDAEEDDKAVLALIEKLIHEGALVEPLGRWVQSRLRLNGIVTGYVPHPAARRPKDLRELEEGLRRLNGLRWPSLRRIWFKAETRESILAGKKTATTRDHQKAVGDWLAVSGSWYKPDPFAVITITGNEESTWPHSLLNFRAEGFESLEDMHRFAYETGLQRYARAPHLYYHEFEVKLHA